MSESAIVDWRAVGMGALLGLVVIVPVSALHAVLLRALDDFEDSGWTGLLFVAILSAFFAAGARAGRAAPYAPLANGALAALGAVMLWLPIRVLIWLVRDDSPGLFTGDEAALAPGQLLVAGVLAAALGMIGALMAARRVIPPTR